MKSTPESRKDRSQWTVRKVHSFLEAEKLHIQDWQNVSGAERMAAAWDMVEEAWMLKKHDRNELRFQRVARCLKRGGS
jgi:hypothetical protein